MTGVLRKRKFGQSLIQREDDVKTEGEDIYKPKERGLEQVLRSQPSEQPCPCSDLRLPASRTVRQ